jgi:hypothetical protein
MMQFHRDRTIVASTSVALLCYKRSEVTLSEIAEKPIDIIEDMAGDRAQSIASSAESAASSSGALRISAASRFSHAD